jgi:membrane fusion protein, multidrug efflux system
VLLVLGGFLCLILLYEGVTSVVAYTSDAYVRSDLVGVAPEVTGRIIAVHVRDNQVVHQGNALLSIDPVPFELAVAQHQAEIDEARTLLKVDQDTIAAAQDAVRGAAAAVELTHETQRRAQSLAAVQDAPQQRLDEAIANAANADATLAARQASVARAQAMRDVHQAALEVATAAMATAKWALARTEVVAPVDGAINNLTTRPGDMARANEPMIGVVDARGWRIVANYKQSYLTGFHPGQTVWVWLDSHPWRLYRGQIQGIARAIARNGESGLLPDVAPTTDWIRLQHRFPVTVTLVDPPADLTLYMGADARTLIFP